MRPSVESLKRQAKRLAKASGYSHSEALDQIAGTLGFGNWSQLMKNWSSSPQRPAPIASTSLDAIQAVMARYPDLSAFGFGVYDSWRKTTDQRQEELGRERAEMLGPLSVSQFERCCQWLERVGRRKTINPNVGSSYGLKHRVERFREDQLGAEDTYVANGMFIAAAIHLGFKVKRIGHGPNAFFNISSQDLPSIPGT